MYSRDQSYVQISNSSSIGTVCSLSRRVIIGIRRCVVLVLVLVLVLSLVVVVVLVLVLV